jgi:hypothetical protein
MAARQRWVLESTSLASLMVALDVLVSTARSTIRLRNLSETHAVNPGPDR